jgi:hypothetical protein
MTVAKKVFAAAFADQMYTGLPDPAGPGYNNYYWPFVNYPMYSIPTEWVSRSPASSCGRSPAGRARHRWR